MQQPLKKIPENIVNSSVDDIELDYSDDDEEDEELIKLLEKRLANDTGIRIPAEEVYKRLGITKADWEAVGEVEIE